MRDYRVEECGGGGVYKRWGGEDLQNGADALFKVGHNTKFFIIIIMIIIITHNTYPHLLSQVTHSTHQVL